MQLLKLIHFTEGGIYHGVRDGFSNLWLDELQHLLAGDNPCAETVLRQDGSDVVMAVRYGKEKANG